MEYTPRFFKSKIYTSGVTEKFCLLCIYEVTHTEEEHTQLISFKADEFYLSGLNVGDMLPTKYGCARLISYSLLDITTQGARMFKPTKDLSLTATVEYFAMGLRGQEIVTLDTIESLTMASDVFNKLPFSEQAEIMFGSRGYASRILNRYLEENLPCQTSAELEIEIQKALDAESHQLQLDNDRDEFLDWITNK